MIDLKKIREINAKSSQTYYNLSPFATKDSEACRRNPEENTSFRSEFARDRDRILYSGAYRRYHGKTQVFSFSNQFDEEMTNRNLHTTYVSQISRSISKTLGLNLELVEAIALAHDLGHAPFGHDGERALSILCQHHGVGHFNHNIESLHIVDNISRGGEGLNLTFQVRDGILSHDGEVHDTKLVPQRSKYEADLREYIQYKKEGKNAQSMPGTLEGCVVRISDTIAYIGQDIEDAIRFNILTWDDIPEDCKNYLGNRNGRIIDSLVKAVIVNSYDNDFICFDDETSHYLKKLKAFNYERIYLDKNVKKSVRNIEITMGILFDKYLFDIGSNNQTSRIFKHFLNKKNDRYLESHTNAEKVRDYIATMTDRYFNEEVKDYLLLWK